MTTFVLAIALAAMLGAAFALAVRAVFARAMRSRRARTALDELGSHRHRRVDVLATGKAVVIEGRARGEGPSAIAITARGGVRSIHASVPHARIETDDAHVVVEGPLHVVVGSRGSSRPVDVARHKVDIAAMRAWSGRQPVQVLCDGDRIAARGALREHAGGGSRDTRVIFALAPALGDEAIRVVHLGTPRELAPRGRLPSALVGAILAGGVAFAIVPVPHALKYGACAPDLDAALDRNDPNAGATAERCGDHARAARGFWQNGEFTSASHAFSAARASDALAPTASEVAAHLFAGNLEASADSARRLSASNAGWSCFADALEARSGNAKARLRLEAVAEGAAGNGNDETARLCALLSVDMLSGAERTAAIARLWHPKWAYQFEGTFDPWIRDDEALDDYLFYLLRHEAEPSRHIRAPSWYRPDSFWPGRHVLRLPMALIDGARPSLVSEDKYIRGDHEIHVAVFLSYAGEHATARAVIDRALDVEDGRACADGDDAPCRADRDLLSSAAAIAMRAHDYPRAGILLHQAGVHTESHGYAVLHPYLELMETGDAKAFASIADAHAGNPDWSAAAPRDGAAFAAALTREHHDGRDVLPYVARYMQSGQDELRGFVARSYPPVCWTCGPHELFDHLTHRREAAQALGMTELDAQLQGTAQRFLAVLLRRDIAVPLHVIARLTTKSR